MACSAIKDVSLTLNNGMFGLLGPNGAGKSSLMRTIATLQEADKGTVFLDDLDVLKNKTQVRQLLGLSAAGVWRLSKNFGRTDARPYCAVERHRQ